MYAPNECSPVSNACAVTDLQGNSEAQGDLKSVVLHKMAMRSTQNTYPIALGIRISGVDDATFGQTGGLHSPTTPPKCADPYISLNPYQRPTRPSPSRRWSRTRR